MKHALAITVGLVVLFAAVAINLEARGPRGEALEYVVKSIDPGTWIVTAAEAKSGKLVKFRLSPTLFKNQTFDADLKNTKKGQKFVAKGPRNARLNNMEMLNPLPETEKPRKGSMRGGKGMLIGGSTGNGLQWQVIHVDPKQWIVKAKHRRKGKMIKFRVDPNCFNGFRFRANLKGVKKGKGFSIIAPNAQPFLNCCTLL